MAYLHVKTISGKTFDIIETDGVFPFIESDNASETGYDEITSIENWNYVVIGSDNNVISNEYVERDYKWVRDEIKKLVEDLGINGLSTETDPSILSPATNDQFLVGSSAIKEFVRQDGKVATWNGSSWDFAIKSETGFDNLTSDQKLIATNHKIGSHSQRYSALSNDIDKLIEVGEIYAERVSLTRKMRIAHVIASLHNNTEHIKLELSASTLLKEDNSGLTVYNTPPVSPSNGDKVLVGYDPTGDFIGYELYIMSWDGATWNAIPRIFITFPEWVLLNVSPDGYIDKYTDLGLGGLIDNDNGDGLFDYINGTPGTKWQGGGLRNEPYTPEGFANMSLYADNMLDTLQKGDY